MATQGGFNFGAGDRQSARLGQNADEQQERAFMNKAVDRKRIAEGMAPIYDESGLFRNPTGSGTGGGAGGSGGANVGAGGAPGVTNLQQQFEASLASRPDDVFMTKLKAMSADGASFATDDPSYKWRFDQGQQAVERSNAAKGLLGSGNVLQELQAYGQGAASQEYGAQFERMLKGTHEASSQYDMAFGQLAKLANIDLGYGQLDVSRMNAETARSSSEMSGLAALSNAGTNRDEFQFKKSQAIDAEAGIRDALSGMAFAPPVGGGGYTPNATGTHLPAYSPNGNTSYYETVPSGGSWSSSSGGSGVF